MGAFIIIVFAICCVGKCALAGQKVRARQAIIDLEARSR